METHTNFTIHHVKELKQLLRLRDLRSVKRWCTLNGVVIMKDRGSRFSYVMRSEFEAARMRQFTKSLQERHGKDWIDAYHAHVDFNIETLSAIQDASRNFPSKRNVDLPVFTSAYSKSFLEKIDSLDTDQ